MSREAIKHTPGPWNYDRSGYSLYVNSGRELVTALSMDGKRLETSEANARLIAAAPDLLKSLERWQTFARNNGWTDADYQSGGIGWITEMNAAIAAGNGHLYGL